MKTVKVVYTAVFIAIGIVLPIAFHFFGPGLGPVFLPMHIPVLLAGIILGPFCGYIVGLTTPILSSVFTGMPPVIPMLPIMIVELSIYGLVTGYLYRKLGVNIYVGLISAMILGRIGAGVVVWLLVHLFKLDYLPANPLIFIWGAVIKGVPGIVIQLIIIPLVVKYLQNYRGEFIGEGGI